MLYKALGSFRAIRIMLGHTKIENAARYLGVDIRDALEPADWAEIRKGVALHAVRQLVSP
jgi:hypothetical protein